MTIAEELHTIQVTLRYVSIVLLQTAVKIEEEKKHKSEVVSLAGKLFRAAAKTVANTAPLNIYNFSRSTSAKKVEKLIESAEKNVNLGKGENP